jgi:hypothetical protein
VKNRTRHVGALGGAAPLPLAADNGTSPFGTTAPPQLSSLVGAARAVDASTDIDLGSINDGDDNDNADAPGTVVPCWHCYLRTHFLNADQTLMARAEYKHMEKFLSPAEEKCDYLLLGHRSCPSAIANKETERAVKLVQSITQKFCRKKKEKKKPGLSGASPPNMIVHARRFHLYNNVDVVLDVEVVVTV